MTTTYGNHTQREREYLFIDGGCLRSSVKKLSASLFGDENAYRPHVAGLANDQFAKVFYYDAAPGKNHGEAQAAYELRVQPDHDRFAQIQALDRVHVALGQIVGRDRRQKGVDVRLAVDMMTFAFRGNITRATLFAGDADFVPLLKALVGEGLHVTLWHPPQANAELKGAADSTRLFSFKSDAHCLTVDGARPAFFTRSTGGGTFDPATEGLAQFIEVDGRKIAAKWKDETLRVWRGSGENWNFCVFEAPGSSLRNSLIAFDEVHGWDIAAAGESWVQI